MKSSDIASFVATSLPPAVRAILVTGNEPQLIEEATAHVRQPFRRENLHRIDMQELRDSTVCKPRGGNLFGEQAAELFFISGSSVQSAKNNADILAAFFANLSAPTVALCVLHNLEAKHYKTAWLKKISSAADLHLHAAPTDAQTAKFWLRHFAAAVNVNLDDEALTLLSTQTEGNLSAAKQTLAKISLVGDAGNSDTVRAALADGARYDIFDLQAAVLAGRGSRAVDILRNFFAAGFPPMPLLVWLFTDMLSNIAAAHNGTPVRAWGIQASALKELAQQITPTLLNTLLQKTAYADRLCKGVATGDINIVLTDLTIRLAALKRGFKIVLPSYRL